MSKQRAVTLCGALTALPLLLGCAQDGGAPPQAYYALPAPARVYGAPPAAYYPPATAAASHAAVDPARVYAAAPGAPTAVLVVLPGPGDVLTANPQAWVAQGFDVVAPPADEVYRLLADQQAAAACLIAEAQALANAPVWVVGSGPAVKAALAALPAGVPGQVSGVVVTSATSGTGTCSERMVYSYSGGGAPKVSVSKSGNACPPGAPFGIETNQAGPATIAPSSPIIPPEPAVQPNRPRVIETAAPEAETPAARQARIRELAELIKSAPPG
jgi:hypothetical protein